MESPSKLYARDEIYRMLLAALVKKKPLPPKEWSVVKFERELNFSGKFYDPDKFARQFDALLSSVYYLTDYSSRLPERVNLSESNERVREMCGDLADEIEQITYYPEEVIAKHGNLRVWLKAILSVQTCLIYREETERVVAQEAAAKKQRKPKLIERKEKVVKDVPQTNRWQSELAQSIFKKVSGRQNVSEQPSLF